MSKKIYSLLLVFLWLPTLCPADERPCRHPGGPATLTFISGNNSETQCRGIDECRKRDAIVFVHGIYGGSTTWINDEVHPPFDWTKQLPRTWKSRAGMDISHVDVFRLDYCTVLASWASRENPTFSTVDDAIYAALRPLRQMQYRSVGFIAHSLGGIMVPTYFETLLNNGGHPQRAQNSFLITLATPVTGAAIANEANALKSAIGIHDHLLSALEENTLYQDMLKKWSEGATGKSAAHGCRPTHLYVAFEENRTAYIPIVTEQHAVRPILGQSQAIKGFDKNHSEMAKPTGTTDDLYRWVNEDITAEMQAVDYWAATYGRLLHDPRDCVAEKFIPSSDP